MPVHVLLSLKKEAEHQTQTAILCVPLFSSKQTALPAFMPNYFQ